LADSANPFLLLGTNFSAGRHPSIPWVPERSQRLQVETSRGWGARLPFLMKAFPAVGGSPRSPGFQGKGKRSGWT